MAVNKREMSSTLPLTKVQSVATILKCSPFYLCGNSNIVIETAETDIALTNMDKHIKGYA